MKSEETFIIFFASNSQKEMKKGVGNMIIHSKKKIILVMTAVCLVAFAGCINHHICEVQSGETEGIEQNVIYEGPLSCVTHYGGWGKVSLMDMTKEFHEKTLDILNGGTWINEVTKCASDYEFETKSEKIRYHSECGTFIDVTNRCSLSLSDEQQAEINRMLGVK